MTLSPRHFSVYPRFASAVSWRKMNVLLVSVDSVDLASPG